MKEKFAFLKSIRFWKLVLAAVIYVLGQYGVIPMELATGIVGLLGIDVAIKTIDKFSTK